MGTARSACHAYLSVAIEAGFARASDRVDEAGTSARPRHCGVGGAAFAL
jgi:hypothetical protein